MTEKEKLQQAIDAVKKYESITEAAKKLNIPRKTLSGRYNKANDLGYVADVPVIDAEDEIAIESKVKKINRDNRDLKRKYGELLQICEDQKQQLVIFESFKKESDNIAIDRINKIEDMKKNESLAVLLYSDLHFEEMVDPRTINGLNEYTPLIAKKRSNKFFENSLKLIEMSRSKSNIKKSVLWIGGDLISGNIHEELLETGAMSPIDSCLKVFELLVSGINYLIEFGDLDELIVVTNVGNHSRTTQKRRISTNVQNNFEWMLYNFLAKYYRNEPKLKFNLTRSYFNYLDIDGYSIRFHHGENIRYFGGVGGISIPVNKAIAQWNQARRVNLDVFGHWHQRLSTKDFVSNGSIIGYNAYAMSIKASFEKPQQSFFLVNAKRGKTVEAPIFVD
jgi:hypothetical protein